MLQTIAIVVASALTLVAVVMAVMAVRSMLGVIRVGQPANRSDNPGRRTVTMLKETLLHTRMLQWTWIGVMHWFVFAGFIYLSSLVATAYLQVYFGAETALPVIGHWPPFEWVAELLGWLTLIGIVFLIVVRQKYHPRKLDRKSRFFGSTFWQAYFVEAIILGEAFFGILIRGLEYQLFLQQGSAYGTATHFPFTAWFGAGFSGMSESALESTILLLALGKIIMAMVWLIVISRNISMGVAWHRFTAWFNIWFKRESDGGTALGAVKPLTSGGKAITLDDIDDLDEDSVLGAGSIEDFSWKGILDFTTCTECGRCQSQCPAWNTEKPLSPKLLIMGLRDHAYAKAAGDDGVADRALVGSGSDDDWFYNPEGADFVIDEDVLWSCTNCGACVQQCPVDIEHVDHIIDMRRYQTLVEANFPSELNGLFKGLENKGNPWNMSATARMDWAQGLDFEVKVVGEDIESLDEVDWLFWVGCAGAYEDRAKKTTRAVAELLDMAGVSFGVLGNGETCTGDSARRAGNEFVFQGLAQQNVETFKEYKVKKVVSTCAHCFNTLRNEYKEFGIELEVVHHTQLLNQLVRDGKLTPVANGDGAHQRSITYHDPCFLGRHNQVYTPPRELLQIMPGAEYKEMERANERSFCCGAGGARMWMEETLGERINVDRTTEAVGTGADQIAVGCPFCRVMLADGLTKLQADGEAREEVEILDVAQMLLASVKGEQATKLKPGEGVAAGVAVKTETPAEEAAPAVAGTAAAGGSSLFGDAPAAEPAAPAAKAAPADAGGSLFGDDTGGSSLFDEAPAEPAATAAPAEGGSLFDTPAPAPAEPEAKPTDSGGSLFDMAPAEPEPAAKAAPAAESPAEEPKAAEPQADLGAGGSLFDVAPAEPAAEKAAEPAAEKPAEPVPAATPPAAAPEPAVDLSSGSLFDLAAPAEPVAEPAAPAVETEPEPTAEEVVAEEEPATKAVEEEAAEEAAESAAEAPAEEEAKSSGAANKPRTDADINDTGSLFDL